MVTDAPIFSFVAWPVKTGFSRLPAGPGGSVGTMGGTGTAVSAHSAHRREAIALLRYQLRGQLQTDEKEAGSGSALQAQFFNPPSISEPGAVSIVARPSIPTGSKYKDVSKAYIDTVYSVLTGKREAPEAVAALEKQLIEITGFSAAPPRTAEKKAP